ncbi:zeta toxin family protein [Clavibacter zhangzhiyongii]|uniref:zeta toxin family protein n=1 Tax=Clavibacter TaxID=1573 RepID=UPI0039DFCD2E
MTSVDDDQHLASLREMSRPGGPLTLQSASTTTRNPAWWNDGRPELAREQLHDRLLSEKRDATPEAGRNRRAILMAGPPGAGKTRIRDEILGAHAGEFVVVDPDEFKVGLLEAATEDGTYEKWVVPEAVRVREAAGERFFPMELSSLVHEESDYLARRLERQCLADGDDVILDTVLSSDVKGRDLARRLERAGYDVQVVDVEVPREVSEERIRTRWREGNERAEQGEGLGGRWVPSEFGAWVYGEPGGASRPEANARMVAEESPAVSRYRVYRTTAEQAEAKAPPVLVTDMSRATRGGPLMPTRSGPDAGVLQSRALPGIRRAVGPSRSTGAGRGR